MSNWNWSGCAPTCLWVWMAAAIVAGPIAVAADEPARWQPTAWTAAMAPEVTARAAFVYDATAGVPLLASNPDEPLPPASLTKIVTAMVVLEHADFDAVVEILPEDVVDETQSRVGLLAGDRLSVRDLFFGLLIPSGNDAALALARAVGATLPGGDQDPIAAFVDEMNRWAVEHGATGTSFDNPTGMPSESQRATARDLAVLTADAMQDPLFAEVVATSRAVLPSGLRPEGYEIFTTNDMLIDGSAIGVKTGTLQEAGGCVVIAARISGNLVVSVVLGSDLVFDEAGNFSSPARFADTRSLLAAAEEAYAWVDPAAPGTIPGLTEELAAWGAVMPQGGAVPVPKEQVDDLSYRVRLDPPGPADAPSGTVLLLVGSDLLTQRTLEQAQTEVAQTA